MTSPARHDLVGLLVLRGHPPAVLAWAAKGVVPVTVGRLDGWTVLLPGGASRAAPPYDDAVLLLAARPLAPRLGPALGFWVIDGRAVLTVQGRRGAGVRWVVWEPEHGLVRPPGLDLAPPAAIVGAAGGGSREELVEILHERHVPPERLLAAVVTVLELPGARLLLDKEAAPLLLGEPRHVEPDDAQVGRFDDAVRDAVLLRRELEHDP